MSMSISDDEVFASSDEEIIISSCSSRSSGVEENNVKISDLQESYDKMKRNRSYIDLVGDLYMAMCEKHPERVRGMSYGILCLRRYTSKGCDELKISKEIFLQKCGLINPYRYLNSVIYVCPQLRLLNRIFFPTLSPCGIFYMEIFETWRRRMKLRVFEDKVETDDRLVFYTCKTPSSISCFMKQDE